MATQKPRTRPNTSKTTKLTKFTFRWWMGLILIWVVAVIGIVVLRNSHASTSPVSVNCAPTVDTSAIIATSKDLAQSQSYQRCMAIAFLNTYTDYHKRVGNAAQIQSNISRSATSNQVQTASVEPTKPAIPKVPLQECNGGPITEPSQAKYPVVDGSDGVVSQNSYKTIFSEKPGSKISQTARNWLGTTGNCFYQFTQSYFPLKSYSGYAWCALFASYIYGVNDAPIGAYPNYLIPTVNELVYTNLARTVPSSVVTAGGYVPRAGDMIAYEKNGDNFFDHVGIVVSTVEDPQTKQRFVITREGNVRVDPNNQAPYVEDAKNIVGVRAHALTDTTIIGYIRAPGNELPL